MKLYYSPASPFVRKVLVTAIELGLDARIERLPAAVGILKRNMDLVAHNPLGQVPTLVTDDGKLLYDSRVICEYLDSLAGGGRTFPAALEARFRALSLQSGGDGLLNAASSARQEETLRPAELRWDAWREAQFAKITSVLDHFEHQCTSFDERVDIGTITVGCGLGYLDFRHPTFDWRRGRSALEAWFSRFGARPSMAATAPAERPK